MHCLQLEEYKDAFRIFDRSGLGSFTAEDIGWVMRSLGQSPTQQQIDAIIRDMDLDNDGVIDLAEFMVRMMAFTTKVTQSALWIHAVCISTCLTDMLPTTPLDRIYHPGVHAPMPACRCLSSHGKGNRHTCHFCMGGLGETTIALQAAPEEDLKHVFDVLDKSGEGMITADSLRLAIKVCSTSSALEQP